MGTDRLLKAPIGKFQAVAYKLEVVRSGVPLADMPHTNSGTLITSYRYHTICNMVNGIMFLHGAMLLQWENPCAKNVVLLQMAITFTILSIFLFERASLILHDKIPM